MDREGFGTAAGRLMKFRSLSDDGRKLNLNWDHINTYTSRWKPHTVFDIEIVKRQPRKSDPMRRYYFAAVLPPFMEELGYDPDEEMLFHNQLKITYFKVEPDDHGIYRKVPSVFSNESEIPVDQKAKYIDWVCRKAAQYGVYIESPNE